MSIRRLATTSQGLKARVKRRSARYRQFIRRTKKNPIPLLPFKRLAHAVESTVDCTACANCCKTMRIQLNGSDIKRLARHTSMSVPAFKTQYLIFNQKDQIHEMKTRPCPFLSPENLCTVYAIRPRDCRGYPFLQEHQPIDYRLPWMVDHAESCPIIFNTLEDLMERYG